MEPEAIDDDTKRQRFECFGLMVRKVEVVRSEVGLVVNRRRERRYKELAIEAAIERERERESSP